MGIRRLKRVSCPFAMLAMEQSRRRFRRFDIRATFLYEHGNIYCGAVKSSPISGLVISGWFGGTLLSGRKA